jgi:hypothetical protein
MVTKWTAEEIELDRALCEFCNSAADHGLPMKAGELARWQSFKELCSAYNEWYGTKKPRPRPDR